MLLYAQHNTNVGEANTSLNKSRDKLIKLQLLSKIQIYLSA